MKAELNRKNILIENKILFKTVEAPTGLQQFQS